MELHAVINYFHSPDIYSLDEHRPDDPSNEGALIQIMVRASTESKGAESFDVVVGTPTFFETHDDSPPILVVERWDWSAIRSLLEAKVAEAEGPDWDSVASQLDQWAMWEFRDYRPTPD